MNKQPSMCSLAGAYHAICLPGNKRSWAGSPRTRAFLLTGFPEMQVFLFFALFTISCFSGFSKEHSSVSIPAKEIAPMTINTADSTQQQKEQFSLEYSGIIYFKVVIKRATDPDASLFSSIEITTSIP
jgi:hypothetical protein